MKYKIIAAFTVVCLLSACATGVQSSMPDNDKYLEVVESGVIKLDASKQEIAKRGAVCMSQIIQNGSVHLNDSSGWFGNSSNVSGGQIIVQNNPENGIVVASSRLDYRGKSLLTFNVQSTVTILAKEGRFKIRHTNIMEAQKSTGYIANDGYNKVGRWAGSGWETTKEVLDGLSKRIAQCVIKESSTKW